MFIRIYVSHYNGIKLLLGNLQKGLSSDLKICTDRPKLQVVFNFNLHCITLTVIYIRNNFNIYCSTTSLQECKKKKKHAYFIISMSTAFINHRMCLIFSTFNYLIDPCRHRVKNVPSLQFIQPCRSLRLAVITSAISMISLLGYQFTFSWRDADKPQFLGN